MFTDFSSLWIDMDGTLIDFARGNLKLALESIKDPNYYFTLEPFSENLSILLGELKEYNISLHIVSGIPDPQHCKSIPLDNYNKYYRTVCRAKNQTISTYFNGLFDTVDYLTQSESKARLVKNKYNPSNPVFIDDMKKYIYEWENIINKYTFQVGRNFSCEDYLRILLGLKGGDLDVRNIPSNGRREVQGLCNR